MKIIIKAKNEHASKVLEDEIIDLKSLGWFERKQFKLLFEVRQIRSEDVGRLREIHLIPKNRIPAMVAPGIYSDSIGKNLRSQGLLQKEFSIEEERP